VEGRGSVLTTITIPAFEFTKKIMNVTKVIGVMVDIGNGHLVNKGHKLIYCANLLHANV
jgi:hypothetical protein